MTANAFAEDRQKAISMGMNDHVAKPIDMNCTFTGDSKIYKVKYQSGLQASRIAARNHANA